MEDALVCRHIRVVEGHQRCADKDLLLIV
jgi:hypothetical protein